MELNNKHYFILAISIIVIVLSTYRLSDNNRFDEELGPPSTEIWRVSQTWSNITLVELSSNPKKAFFEFENSTYAVIEDDWTLINEIRFKIRIYPEKEYVWIKVD